MSIKIDAHYDAEQNETIWKVYKDGFLETSLTSSEVTDMVTQFKYIGFEAGLWSDNVEPF